MTIIDSVKTHVEVKNPTISIPRLADYMAASEQARRTIVSGCKYRPLARITQHDDARTIIAEHLCLPIKNPELIEQRLEQLSGKICDTEFEEKTKQHNCDYVSRFIGIEQSIQLPNAVFSRPGKLPPTKIHGTKITFQPDVLITRTTQRNTVKCGALMLRYRKRQPLNPEVGRFQSAFLFGHLRGSPIPHDSQPERKICITVDAYAGKIYEAPGNAVYEYKNMLAACASIAERWPAIKPPTGAIL